MGCMHFLSAFSFSFSLITLLVFSCCCKCEGRDSISVGELLKLSTETLVSAGSRFELGFFTPEGNNGSRYLGIWYYNVSQRIVVWVAKRDAPLPSSCGGIRIREDDGNVEVECSKGEVYPVTQLARSADSNRTLQLLDSGNLVLVDANSSERVWQSFSEPTDTFLPGMKLNDTVKLSSWISPSNPAEGDYSFVQEQGVYQIYERSVNVHWKSNEPGSFIKDSSFMKDALPSFVDQMLSGSATTSNERNGNGNGKRTIKYNKSSLSPNFNYSRLVMNSSGQIQFYNLSDGVSLLSGAWPASDDPCSVYNACGKFGLCNTSGTHMCTCPLGFNPGSSEDWDVEQYSDGCDRVQPAECSQRKKFVKIPLMRIGGSFKPIDHAPNETAQLNETACEGVCLDDCKCQAYYFEDAIAGTSSRCWVWIEVLNLHWVDPDAASIILSLRVSEVNPKKGTESQRVYVIAITALVAGIILLSCSACILYRRRTTAERPGYNRRSEASSVFFSNESQRQVNNLMQENGTNIDVPFYNLDSILSATDSFSDANKLGQGGFGPVYKGRFPGGHEIAVKRLSSCSGQGIEEFLNEVVLIAKLQHRNLVRLLGYCIKGSEKILLYEYMPNRSLDAFLFDEHNRLLLDWKKRFDIILGIARGLLYLHQDSRLRIIHRDLKTSNILLDEDMNPKISDFGLARIVEGKGTEASTNKVVGTYGYMSPEYALDGKFSTKSDVFSFGVVMLEIISGRKNTGFYNPQQVLNLLGYTWRLWCDNKALDVIDPTLSESCEKSEVIKCINIGLLCVQEDPNERPSMSTVVIMLGSETSPLPLPTQPAFVVRRRLSTVSSSSSSTKPDSISVNELTFTTTQGR
ncbi:G-type lectin S-receptor-like serine/threonine-protein kinase At4g03230 isoform X2 [Salvia miltiorrhiza]|uniref:G-type lectin S-receptor-like serine/threonine-protein kinase At4g03230 isoform X2 n=1 Tax=Salvia miltiorrhiza TaxID=226208 RepID=UPI0025AC4DD0|nr:G-type lectin S-receptor-like serine/threonine-protein kinase At4g03230 isoform X2 [Salvia miltiorrhiza]